MVKEKIHHLFWFDTETTGLDPKINDVIQLSYLIERVDFASKRRGEVLVEQNLFLRPLNPQNISAEAMRVNGRTLKEILEFPAPELALRTLKKDKIKYLPVGTDKMMAAGYNVDFDRQFLINLFDVKMGKREGAYWEILYYAPYLCVMQQAFSRYVADALIDNSYPDLPDMKLKSVAKLVVSREELDKVAFHDASADIRLTRDIWYRMHNL